MELDEVWPAVAKNDLMGFTLEEGSTGNKAMEQVYYESVAKSKEILCETRPCRGGQAEGDQWGFVSTCQKYEANGGCVHFLLDPPTPATRAEKLLAAKVEDVCA